MGRSTIALVWLGGIVLTALIYVAGPGHFIFAVTSALSQAEWAVGNAVAYLSWRAFDLVRAAAIALFVVYLVLGILASQRGLGRGGMVGISVLFVVLIALGGYEFPVLLVRRAAGGRRRRFQHDPAAVGLRAAVVAAGTFPPWRGVALATVAWAGLQPILCRPDSMWAVP